MPAINVKDRSNDFSEKINFIQIYFPNISISKIKYFLHKHNYDTKSTIDFIIKEMLKSSEQMEDSFLYMTKSQAELFKSKSSDCQNTNCVMKALLIGITYETSKQYLSGCFDDVMRIKLVLTKIYGFIDSPSCIRILTDSVKMKDAVKPTRKNILDAYKWLTEDADSEKILFLYYSGHGGLVKDLNKSEYSTFDQTILPCDYKESGHISDDLSHELLVKKLKKGVKLFCIFDCCYSGSALDLPYIYRNNSWITEKKPKFSKGEVILISSCQDLEKALDLSIPKWGGGGILSLGIVIFLCQRYYNCSLGVFYDWILEFTKSRSIGQQPQLSSTMRFNIYEKIIPFTKL